MGEQGIAPYPSGEGKWLPVPTKREGEPLSYCIVVMFAQTISFFADRRGRRSLPTSIPSANNTVFANKPRGILGGAERPPMSFAGWGCRGRGIETPAP